MSSTQTTSIESSDVLRDFPLNESDNQYNNETLNKKSLDRDQHNEVVDETDFVNNESIVSKRLTIAGGFLDFALFSANVEHLKFVIDTGHLMKYQQLLLTLLILSLLLQLIAGVVLFISGFRKSNHMSKDEAFTGKVWDEIMIGLVTIIALVNVFITIFGDRSSAVESLLAECGQRTTQK